MRSSSESKAKIFAEFENIDFEESLPVPQKPVYPIRKERRANRLKIFLKNLENAKAETYHISEEQLNEVIGSILKEKKLKNIILPAKDKTEKILKDLKKKTDFEYRVFQSDYEKIKPELYAADAGISRAAWGIAETGSLVLASGAQSPRTLSLIPPLNICILEEAKIYSDFEALINRENMAENMPTNLVLISGPSRTADIEFKISLGIHGPKELIVIVIS